MEKERMKIYRDDWLSIFQRKHKQMLYTSEHSPISIIINKIKPKKYSFIQILEEIWQFNLLYVTGQLPKYLIKRFTSKAALERISFKVGYFCNKSLNFVSKKSLNRSLSCTSSCNKQKQNHGTVKIQK